ncbi:MAG: helix-turn-helix domain-containing protein [Actinomycetota bacterium]
MTDESADPTDSEPTNGLGAFGDFIRTQRRLADLSQRELARISEVSDAYLSQLERGLHEPSVRVVNAISSALNLPSDKLLGFLGGQVDADDGPATEAAILTDDRLTDAQKQSLLDVLNAFLAANDHT